MAAQVFWSPTPGTERIVCAAVLYTDGVLLVGPRHFDAVMHKQYAGFGCHLSEAECAQGFLDQYGQFHTREQAWVIAERNGQIIRDHDKTPGRLFSENLY